MEKEEKEQMKFLLIGINAKYIHSNLAIYDMKAYAMKQEGGRYRDFIDIAEYTIHHSCNEIVKDIYLRNPDVIGISCYIWNIRLVEDVISQLYRVMPKLEIWLGGPEASYYKYYNYNHYNYNIYNYNDCNTCNIRNIPNNCNICRTDGEHGGHKVEILGKVPLTSATSPSRNRVHGAELLERFPYLRGIMIGEGEKTFVSLLRHYVDGEETNPLRTISGICFRDAESGEVIQNEVGEALDLSEVPFPYFKDFKDFKDFECFEDFEDFEDSTPPAQEFAGFENRIVYYESSRGCPFSCSYCLSSVEKRLRFRDLGMVKRELQFFLDHKVRQVKFVDRTFNCNHERALEIWRFLLERDNGITNFHFEIAADLLQEEELELLSQMRAGLIQLEIGVQSVNPKTLQAVHRQMNLERLEQNVARIRNGKNIHQHLDLIAGLPYEDYASFADSFCKVYAMQPNQLQLGFLKVLSGTEMEADCAKYGIIYQENPPYEVLSTKWLSYQEILALKGIEKMVEQYYNSAQFTHSLACLEPYFSTPFEMYHALAEFYENGHFVGEKHSRLQRYEKLLEFAKGYLCGKEWKRFQEAMVYDVYLRENAKTRPSFAEKRDSDKEVVKQFCIQEEKERRYLPDYKEYSSRQLANQIHIERFRFYATAKEGQDTYVVFDYKNRNPLTYEAHTISLQRTPAGLAPVTEILRLLDKHYSIDYKCYLNHQTPWQLLIATILSAQCTDARVNLVTKDLFVKYPTLEAFANANQNELEQDIHSTGFYKNKAKNIIACTKTLIERYHGEVPQEIEELTQLAGVGRKTANVIRGNIYHIPSVVVDTHVKRISRKLGLTLEEDPEKIEIDLMNALPEDHWILWNIQIITHGRGVCTARNPNCGACFLRHLCKAAEDTAESHEKKKREII